MKKFRAVIASVFTALTLICVSAMNTFATTLGKSTIVNPDSINNNTVKTGDKFYYLIALLVVLMVVLVILLIKKFKNMNRQEDNDKNIKN